MGIHSSGPYCVATNFSLLKPLLFIFVLLNEVIKFIFQLLFSLQEEYDTHDPKGHCPTILPFLRKRSKIIEIVAAHDIVFALAQSGICAAFSRG